MRKIVLHKQQALRFCRWSRKAYGVFISLHREVSIGQVCKSIADAAISKSDHLTVKQTCTAAVPSNGPDSSGGGEGDAGWPSSLLPDKDLITAIIFTALSNTAASHCQEAYCLFNKNTNGNVLSRSLHSTAAGRFLFISNQYGRRIITESIRR